MLGGGEKDQKKNSIQIQSAFRRARARSQNQAAPFREYVPFATCKGRSSDCDLRLTGLAGKVIRREHPLTEIFPVPTATTP